MKTNKSLRAKVAVVLAVAVMIASSIACDENPCADGSACGITSPHGDVMDNAIDFIERTDPAGDSNNW